MKSVSDYIKLICEEGEAATNVVSSGAIAMKEVPLGKVAKRKAQHEAQKPVTAQDGVEVKVALSDVYAPEEACVEIEKGATPEDADKHKKHMFHLKQQHQADQISNL